MSPSKAREKPKERLLRTKLFYSGQTPGNMNGTGQTWNENI